MASQIMEACLRVKRHTTRSKSPQGMVAAWSRRVRPADMSLKSLTHGMISASESAGKGVLAGIAATAAMTASSTLEMKLRGRGASNAPSTAAGKVLGVQPRNPEGAARFGNYVHWSYGTAWGALGGLMKAGIPEPYASATHFISIWGTEATLLPAMDIAPPIPEWGAKEIAIDIFHHLVYVAAFAGIWHLLGKTREPNSLFDSVISRF